MMNDCFDEATLQAYLDGELEPDRAGEAAAHLASCASCAASARAATQEFAMFANAFGADEPLSVPTERLRARIDAAVAELQPTRVVAAAIPSTSIVERLRAFTSSLAASLAFTPRQATAFASFAVAAGLLAIIFYVFRPQASTPRVNESSRQEIASAAPSQQNVQGGAIQNDEGKGSHNSDSAGSLNARHNNEAASARGVNRATAQPASFKPLRGARENGVHYVMTKANDEIAAGGALLPVEKSYVSAIASLKSSIDQQGTRVMTPTLRAEYERNLAVVDHAIVASRVAARRDPADKGAQEFLRTAYQDKLDLLHAVADQTQIASIGR
jgi:hypothetical protein